MPEDKKKKRTNADRTAYAKAEREKAAAAVRNSSGNSMLQTANMAKLRKADNALIKSQEAEKSAFKNSDYTKIKKGMQR